ncbi:MAG: hypothetical protein J0H98_08105 [Solirubrobacterales bacterium]|nr:hypothetical protein [Solirubrobacterales bacterium]
MSAFDGPDPRMIPVKVWIDGELRFKDDLLWDWIALHSPFPDDVAASVYVALAQNRHLFLRPVGQGGIVPDRQPFKFDVEASVSLGENGIVEIRQGVDPSRWDCVEIMEEYEGPSAG